MDYVWVIESDDGRWLVQMGFPDGDAPHLVHVPLAVSEYRPASHHVHLLAPEPENVPARQARQLAALVFDHVPASHLVQVLLASSE